MTAAQYRDALAALSLTQLGAAKVLDIDKRLSRRFAMRGAPDWVAASLADWEFLDRNRTTIFNRHSGRTIRVAEGMG